MKNRLTLFILVASLSVLGIAAWQDKSDGLEDDADTDTRVNFLATAPKLAGSPAIGRSESRREAENGRELEQILPIDLVGSEAKSLVGQGLEAWQNYYQALSEENFVIDLSDPDFQWWTSDPEMVEEFFLQYDHKLQEMSSYFEERRALEASLEGQDPGRLVLSSNIARFGDGLGALERDLEYLWAQEFYSDDARHLSNLIALQAKRQGAALPPEAMSSAFKRFGYPIETLFKHETGQEFSSLTQETQSALLNQFSSGLLEIAQLRSQIQIYEAAAFQATKEIKLLKLPSLAAQNELISESALLQGQAEDIWKRMSEAIRRGGEQ